jgi:hypothetical protein
VPLGVTLKIVPEFVVPNKLPLSDWINPVEGKRPSVQSLSEQKPVERGKGAARGEPEHRATVVGPAICRGPIEVPVGGLDEPVGVIAVGATGLRAEAVKGC